MVKPEADKHKRLYKFIDSEKPFNFRLYAFTPKEYLRLSFMLSWEGKVYKFSANKVPMNTLTSLKIISPTLFLFITESKMGSLNYNPHKVMR